MAAPGIRALLLHETALFVGDGDSIQLRPGADRLLYRLRYSNLLVGISTVSIPLSLKQDALLRSTGSSEFLKPVVLDEDHSGLALEALLEAWKVPGKSSIFFAAKIDEALGKMVEEHDWNIMQLLPGGKEYHLSLKANPVKDLHHLLSAIARLNKKASEDSVILVGHHMKWSREKDFLKRGAFPLLQIENGLSFVPISPGQFDPIDALLTKATDEIISWESGISSHLFHGIKFSESFERVASYLREHPSISVIDPLENIVPLMDRFATQDLLESIIYEMNTRYQKIRAPQFAKIEAVDQPSFLEVLDIAKLGFPTIVKPQIACGASDAHIMAVVLRKEGYHGLKVPFPALVQEYIDHGSKIYKLYILGLKLFLSVRSSMPNAADLSSNSPAIVFDSLKSLPVNENHAQQESSIAKQSTVQLDLEAVEYLAAALRSRLGLTIFGIDIVIQEGTNDHVIVDVNYFPSFKDIPDSEAIPAFWNAIKDKCHLRT